jgi:hypothetical protein
MAKNESAGPAKGVATRRRDGPKRTKTQRVRKATPSSNGDQARSEGGFHAVVADPGERILNWAKEREAPQQAHSPGKCGRCLGRTFDCIDGRGVMVWYCGKCDVLYDNA